MIIKDLDELYPELTRVETTIGSNGYPEQLKYAYYLDDKDELMKLVSKLEADGYNITELLLRRKNGQQLWNREESYFNSVDFSIAKDSDYVLSINMDNSEDEIKEEIKTTLFYDDEDLMNDIIDEFYNELRGETGGVTVFYDPNNDDNIDYIIRENDTGYHDGDVTSYQMAFIAEKSMDESKVNKLYTSINEFKQNLIKEGLSTEIKEIVSKYLYEFDESDNLLHRYKKFRVDVDKDIIKIEYWTQQDVEKVGEPKFIETLKRAVEENDDLKNYKIKYTYGVRDVRTYNWKDL